MNDTPFTSPEEWLNIEHTETKEEILQRFRELSNTAFSEGILAHKSENELLGIVMAIFLQILRKEDLHRDRDFLESLREIAGQIHAACEEQEKAERQAQVPDTPVTIEKSRKKFWRIFRKAA